MDADFKTIFVNNKMADLLGYSSDEMVGKVVMDFMFEEDLDKHWERMQKRVKGFPGEYEHRFKCKNGDEIWLSVSASALKDENGEFFGSFAMFTDITERKKAEEALKESEERYRNIFENAVEGIFQSTPDGNYLSLNPAFAHMYGYGSPDEMIREVSDIQKQLYAYDEDREKVKELLNTKGVIKNFEVEFNRKDGKKLWASINATALKDKNGNIYYEGTTQDITERKKAEKALKESEEFLDNVVENIPNMIFIKSADDLSFKLINKAGERLLGHSREELMGKTDHDFFPKNEADFFTQKDREVLKNKTLLDIPEETIETKKLGQRILHTKKIPLVDSDNNPQYLLGISEDITELKKAENSLKDSEEMLRDVIFGSPIPTFVIDKNHKVIYWNHALEKQSGIKAKLIVGTDYHWKAFYDKKRPCMADLLLNGLEEDISKWYPKKFKKSKLVEGAYEATDFFPNLGEKGKWLHFTASVVKDAQGDVVSAVETLEDITQQKVAEKSLKKSFKRFSALAESAVDGIVTTSINGRIKFFNESFLNIFGYEKSELLNKPITLLMPKRKHNIFMDTLEKFKKTSEHRLSGRITESIGLRKDGTEFPFEMSLAIWKSGDNKYFTSIIRDITDRKKAENILKESIKEKEILLREIHHRVKNNLQIIASLLRLQEGSVNDEMVEVLMESEGRVKTMAMVHEKLYQSPSFTDINFKEYIQRLVQDLYSSYAINTHDIRTSLDIEDINLNIDTSIPLGLIINELMTNSIKHAFNEGKGEIKIILRSKWDEYELIVSDSGKGIPKDLDFRTTSSLGLQIVNSLVSQIDGKITLDRINGTKFQITFKELEYSERI
jgi:PAS domain S-box-containing protein